MHQKILWLQLANAKEVIYVRQANVDITAAQQSYHGFIL